MTNLIILTIARAKLAKLDRISKKYLRYQVVEICLYVRAGKISIVK